MCSFYVTVIWDWFLQSLTGVEMFAGSLYVKHMLYVMVHWRSNAVEINLVKWNLWLCEGLVLVCVTLALGRSCHTQGITKPVTRTCCDRLSVTRTYCDSVSGIR